MKNRLSSVNAKQPNPAAIPRKQYPVKALGDLKKATAFYNVLSQKVLYILL
jgi:hypothetical protein